MLIMGGIIHFKRESRRWGVNFATFGHLDSVVVFQILSYTLMKCSVTIQNVSCYKHKFHVFYLLFRKCCYPSLMALLITHLKIILMCVHVHVTVHECMYMCVMCMCV